MMRVNRFDDDGRYDDPTLISLATKRLKEEYQSREVEYVEDRLNNEIDTIIEEYRSEKLEAYADYLGDRSNEVYE